MEHEPRWLSSSGACANRVVRRVQAGGITSDSPELVALYGTEDTTTIRGVEATGRKKQKQIPPRAPPEDPTRGIRLERDDGGCQQWRLEAARRIYQDDGLRLRLCQAGG